MAKSSRSITCFLFLFAIVGFVVVCFGIWTAIKSIRATHWPVAEGVVQASTMKRHTSNGSHGGDTFSPEVSYTFQANGASFTGNKISFGQMSSSTDYAQRILDRYPVGKKVSVYYDPANPSEAVLETGIHGGTWVLLAVGTIFMLAGSMFLQIFRKAQNRQIDGTPSSTTIAPDGRFTMDKPPVLMGAIFLIFGIGICFLQPAQGIPAWIVYAGGAAFALIGIFIFLFRLENKSYSKIVSWLILVLFLGIFHWVSFGAGERMGTSSSPFSEKQGVNVRTPFAIFTVLMDVVIAAALIYQFIKRRKD